MSFLFKSAKSEPTSFKQITKEHKKSEFFHDAKFDFKPKENVNKKLNETKLNKINTNLNEFNSDDLNTLKLLESAASLLNKNLKPLSIFDADTVEDSLGFEIIDFDKNNCLFVETSTPQDFEFKSNFLFNDDLIDPNEFYFDIDNININNQSSLSSSSSSLHNNKYINYLCSEDKKKFNLNTYLFNLNDYVCINDKKCGYLKYLGRVHFSNGIFCGIELDEQDGKHDGKIENIRYVKKLITTKKIIILKPFCDS